MDFFCLSLVSEAFPHGGSPGKRLPCVVTREGDAADVLGDDNFVVPVTDSAALGAGLLRMCCIDPIDRKMLGERNTMGVKERAEIGKCCAHISAGLRRDV
jgi:hypothetical protein